MSSKKFCSSIASVAIIFILLSGLASAMGVSPSRVTVDFVPNAEFESEACFSAEGIPLLKVEAIGLLANNIQLEGVGPDGIIDTRLRSGCIKYKVKLPEKIDKPGVHYSGISAVEVPDQTYGNIYAIVRIIHQVFVVVPYPGKYLEANLKAENSNAGDIVPIMIDFQNKGEQKISSASGIIKVYNHEGGLLATLNAGTASDIEVGQSRTLSAKWNSSGNGEGNYRADARLIYEGMDNNITTDFKLGGLDLSMINYTSEIYYGGIKPFTVIVDSIWSEPIRDAKATVYIFNDSKQVQTFETLTRTIPPWGTEGLQGYIDTGALGVGEFDAQINVSFENMTKQYDRKIYILEVPKPQAPKKNLFKAVFSTRNVIIYMGVILIIIIILAAIELKRKKDTGKPTIQVPAGQEPTKAEKPDANSKKSTKGRESV